MTRRITLLHTLALLLIAVATPIKVKAVDLPFRATGITPPADSAVRHPPAIELRIAQGETGARIGGGCSYRDIAGTVTIVGVAKTAASSQQATVSGGPGYQGFEVNFRFTASQPIAEATVRDFARRPHVLRLVNSWYPGPRYVEKYHLDAGRELPALLKVRTSGACTPMLFSISGVDRTDYFERAQ